jgi:hypothetical protein
MGSEKSAGSVTSQQNPHNDYTAYSNNPTPQSIVNRDIVTPTAGLISVGEGSSKYIKEENATYVGTKDGVMRYEGRQTTVGGRFIAGGTVMEGANKPLSETSPEAQQRFQDIKEKGETSLSAAEKLRAATEKIIASRAEALKGVTLRAADLLKEKVFAKQVVGAESYTAGLKEREAVEAQRQHVLNPALAGLKPDLSAQEAAIIKERLSGANYPDYPVFEFQKEDKTITETWEVLPSIMPSFEEMVELAKYPSNVEYQRQRAVEGFQTESENQLFGLPVIGGGLKWFEEGVSGVQEYLTTKNVFGLEKDVVSSSFSKNVLGAANIVKPSTLVSAAKTGGVIAEEVFNEPQQFFKRVGTGVSLTVEREVTAFKTNPAEASATALGFVAGFYLLSGGKPLDFLKSPKEASAVEAIVRKGKPLSISRGLVIGEETGKGLAVRVKAVKTVLGEKGLVEEPIDATFLGTVKVSAGKQAQAFLRANKAAVAEAGGKFKVLSVEKTASSVLQTESKAVATAKGLRVELKGGGTSVFTRVKGEPTTVFLSTGEVAGEGVINIPKSKWRLNVGSKKNFPNALEKISVRGKDVPFKLEYESTSGGGIVEGARVGADFADLGKGVVDASTGKARQELFVNARTTNTPVKMVSAMQDFINRNPKLLRLSVGAKETFAKPLEYIKSKTKAYGKPSTEESVFKLTELGEKKSGKGVAEFYSGGGRTYPNEPIAKPLTLPKSVVGRYLDTSQKEAEFNSHFSFKTYPKNAEILEKSNIPEGYTGKLERFGYSKSYFFGKVKRLVSSKDNFNGGGNNRPLSNSGGGASVDVNVGGGSKQVMELSEAGGKLNEPKVFAVPLGVSEVQIRAAASKAVSDFYAKQAVRSSALGVASTKAVTSRATVSRSGFNTSNRNGTMQFTRNESRTSMQPISRVSNRSSSLLENKTGTRNATRMFDVNALRTRAFTSTGTATETRVGFGTALRLTSNTLTRTATRAATLTRTSTLTRITVTPPPGKPEITPPPDVPFTFVLPKGSVLLSERRRKRLPSKFFLKSKSGKTGRAPLSDLLNLNITALAIRSKPHSPSVRTANKFFERSSGLVVPTAEQIRSKFRF